jgi:predicted permease
VSLVTGILFGLLPALQTSRADLTTSLKEASGRSGTGRGQNIARATLVIVEVALALILLVGSALLIRTALALSRVNPGFDATNVLTMRMSLTGPGYATSEGVALLVANATERLNAIPGVEISSATCCVPLQGGYGLPFVIAGRPLNEGSPFHGGGGWMNVSPGYFEVFRIPIRKGRSFTDQDKAGTPPVVIINEAMARQYFADSDPLAARITIGRGIMREFAAEPERQIIGVVADSRDGGLNQNPGPKMFVPQGQVTDLANALNVSISPIAWVVRTKVAPLTLSQQIQESLRQSTGLPVSQVQSMDDIVHLSTSRQRFNMLLMTTFGIAAMLLAGIGIYGLMAYSVAQRKQEIGIRLALGAQTSAVRRMVVFQGMRLAVVGVIVGLGGAFALTQFIRTFLFEVQEWDPFVFTVMPITLLVIALLAVTIPAIRAARVDPLTALRYE